MRLPSHETRSDLATSLNPARYRDNAGIPAILVVLSGLVARMEVEAKRVEMHPMDHCPGFDAAAKGRNIPNTGQRLGPDKPNQGDGE
jgi:hypothetical protein